MKFGIIVFPGSNCDYDTYHVIKNVLHQEAFFIWHDDVDIKDANCIVLPGGFSYGDYLRSGAMAACAKVMDPVRNFAAKGGLVLGICNGFQILQEAKLLSGALMRNEHLKFICKDVHLRVERIDNPFTCACEEGEVLKMPIAHMDGNFFMDRRSLGRLESAKQVVFRYSEDNPNGSLGSIAGIINETQNVCGLMPHPERCSEAILGNSDGLKIFESIIKWYK